MDINKIIEHAQSLEHQLYIKYKLVEQPNKEDIVKWYRLTNLYIAKGLPPEDASRKAAWETFEIDINILRKSQTDTIEALLLKAQKSVEENEKNGG
ncbi:hypothetical protein [Photobacterium iliopiscarium]|uniref:Uncharacterized protein n=1 Tax=Photobacterium iliopiscarium TaxID=56192 RepID=A0A2T3MMS5_9GAMM|nr:hypothetical protein [Photobacterium iliopiscarium]PSV97856.1 hypothetical protein C9I88_07240 [Photobacterium iliopiscarium]